MSVCSCSSSHSRQNRRPLHAVECSVAFPAVPRRSAVIRCSSVTYRPTTTTSTTHVLLRHATASSATSPACTCTYPPCTSCRVMKFNSTTRMPCLIQTSLAYLRNVSSWRRERISLLTSSHRRVKVNLIVQFFTCIIFYCRRSIQLINGFKYVVLRSA